MLLTESLLRSIANVLEIDIAIPDHTTLSRRGGGLTVLPKRVDRDEPLHHLVDSTGLKIYGEGEWLDQKHGLRSRRRWLALGAFSVKVFSLVLLRQVLHCTPKLLGSVVS